MTTYLGIDIGGTNIKGALVDLKGNMLTLKECPTPKNKDDIIEAISSFSEMCQEDTEAVGIGIAGPIDKKNGLIYPPNITVLDGFDTNTLIDRFQLPVLVENDANCFALAVHRFGEGKGTRDSIYVTLGTGIGGGIMVNGKLLEGKDGAAGEIGHIIIEASSDQYHSGVKGSMENLASGTAIGRRCGMSAEEASDRAREGDEKAKASFAEAGRYLGIGLASLANVFNPEIIVIGGSVIRSREFFEEEMHKAFKERCRKPACTAKIQFSSLNEPGIIGAAVRAIEGHEHR